MWVYSDSRKRYDSVMTSILFGILSFLLGPPMLIFYIVVRPDIRFEDFDDWEAGGVNVPIVNFMGKEGIEMSFELRINPRRLKTDKGPTDMSLEIGWDNVDEKFKLIDKQALAQEIIGEEPTVEERTSGLKIFNFFDETGGYIKRKVRAASKRVKVTRKKSSDTEQIKKSEGEKDASFPESVTMETAEKKGKKKKNKKKRKKKK
jgi:hypothetical protein